MKRFVTQLLVITLLFASAEAAYCSVTMLIDHQTDEELLIDNDEQFNTDSDSSNDSCDYCCFCANQLGIIFSHTFQSSQSFSTNSPFDYGRYNSQPSPSLLRPPIF